MNALQELLSLLDNKRSTDLHLCAGSPPMIRVDGDLGPVEGRAALTDADVRSMIFPAMTEAQRARLQAEQELDFSIAAPSGARFRVNLFFERGRLAGAFRAVPTEVWSFEDLGLPDVVRGLADRDQGLVLVTGATGSGKTTTLATLIDHVNTTFRGHIVTLEDPIEFVHENKLSLVHQREVGGDTESFHKALKYISRQDPDVVLIGEMRDRETMEAALTVAETGHLTFATLHTNSAPESIHRILDAFPADRQPQVRTQLSMVLAGVVTQKLLPRRDGGRIVAAEVLIPTPAVRHLIREGKEFQIYNSMQIGQDRHAMRTMNQSLADLLRRREIRASVAFAASPNPEELDKLLASMGVTGLREDSEEAMVMRAQAQKVGGAHAAAFENARRAPARPAAAGANGSAAR